MGQNTAKNRRKRAKNEQKRGKTGQKIAKNGQKRPFFSYFCLYLTAKMSKFLRKMAKIWPIFLKMSKIWSKLQAILPNFL
jgi:5-methylcytosine-specific restriction endonuclease McrA